MSLYAYAQTPEGHFLERTGLDFEDFQVGQRFAHRPGVTLSQQDNVTESLDTPVVRLSGGNQQKVLISKWIGTNPSILLLDEPTRGVDVGAKAEIYRILLAQRDAGLSIVISSSEAPELLTLCDRIVVMHAGRVAGTLHKHEADEGAIFRLAMGHVQ